jgi:hypothetical protein
MTNSAAAIEVRKYEGLKPHIEYMENKIVVRNENYIESPYFIMRSKHKLNGVGCIVREIDEGIYLIRAGAIEFEVGLEEK